METTHILYIGKHAAIREVVLRLINSNKGWNGIGAEQEQEAKALFGQHRFSLVLFGSGIDEDGEKRLCQFFTQQQPNIIIVQHYGGGSGLLKSEILTALERVKS